MTRRQGKPPSQRQLRVGEEIRHALANLIERGEIRDPELAAGSVTVTEVRVSPDLRNATAFVTPFGGGDAVPKIKALKRVKPFLRHELAHKLNLRYAPELFFEEDTSLDQASRIDALLRSADVRRDLVDDPDSLDDEMDGGDQEGRDDGA
jgi:ribosome-binding factor A